MMTNNMYHIIFISMTCEQQTISLMMETHVVKGEEQINRQIKA